VFRSSTFTSSVPGWSASNQIWNRRFIRRSKLFAGHGCAHAERCVRNLPWLRSIERLFADFGVNDGLKVHLLKPHLTEHARNLIARMDPDKASRYADVKQLLLQEFKLSSRRCFVNGLTQK
jgi:hypothetical protein